MTSSTLYLCDMAMYTLSYHCDMAIYILSLFYKNIFFHSIGWFCRNGTEIKAPANCCLVLRQLPVQYFVTAQFLAGVICSFSSANCRQSGHTDIGGQTDYGVINYLLNQNCNSYIPFSTNGCCQMKYCETYFRGKVFIFVNNLCNTLKIFKTLKTPKILNSQYRRSQINTLVKERPLPTKLGKL